MDIRLNYIEKGMGNPLVLLHGNGENHEYFESQLEYFSPRFRVIAPDTRGHGGSERGKAFFTLDQFAIDLKELMYSLGIDKADILGFSDGGNIALLFALKYPALVRRLILNGANLFPSGMKTREYLSIITQYAVLSVLSPFSANAFHKKELYALMAKQPHISPDSLRSLKMPVLVIVGTDDMIKESHTRLICSSLPAGKLRIIKGDHFIAQKKSPEFNKAVDEFLSEYKL
ncbi:2-succinyl-6-hydroxy-2,4-cyclohexadiene-1-carboxylate synthase [bioreactor metagenome]|uniref:2-succinyl-6-hydroxy-2, 4-cyclohexadiene-1-carboxylate synthase n=1 Tax=bioreactor metagenome TaxID=1076179 RepID=A0A645BLU8_9ZZZZ|nr:alpha/beta hydrolase [Oscillospiraceae bacterium]